MGHNIMEKTMVEMTWCEVDKMARLDAIVLLPLGVIEEHSRHLPLGTDIYLAAAQCQQVAHELNSSGIPCVIAPPFYWGISSVTTKCFPGSFVSRPETIDMIISDILESLENAGFRRVVSLNAHGDHAHIHAIARAFTRFNSTHKLRARWLEFEDDAEGDGFTPGADNLLAIPPFNFDFVIKYMHKPRDRFDVHAGATETALMRESFPELVDEATASRLPATDLNEEGIRRWNSGKPEDRAAIPDGHAGDPAFSTYVKTHSDILCQVIADGIRDFYKKNKV